MIRHGRHIGHMGYRHPQIVVFLELNTVSRLARTEYHIQEELTEKCEVQTGKKIKHIK